MKTYEEKAYSALKRIEEETEARMKKKRALTKVLVPAASLCFAAIIGIGIWQFGISQPSDITPFRGNTPSQKETLTQDGTQNQGENYTDESDPDSFTEIKYAVYTDDVELPENVPVAALNMMGCLVYKCKAYTQSGIFDSYDPDDIEKLVGEYLGEAKGTLDEWSTQDAWAIDFASTYLGSVYKVNGYSDDFRLCIYENSDDGQFFQLLDNYDGIGLNTGADLFEERLHIKNNVKSVTYRTHADWNEGNFNYQELSDITEEQFDEFLNKLCDSPFERIDHMNISEFYETEKQGHLYLSMKDGTYVELILIDGGYVGCPNLNLIFAKMSDEIFDTVLAACQ